MTEPTSPTPPAHSTPAAGPVKRRLTSRRLLIAASALALLVIGGYYAATSPWVLGRLVLARLGSSFGGTATAARVKLTPEGSLILESPSLSADDVEGPAAVVFSASRITAKVNLRALTQGGKLVESITLDRPVIRISQSTTDGSVNVASLKTSGGLSGSGSGSGAGSSGKPDAPGSPQSQIPQIILNNGIIEIGEHADDGSYTLLKRLDVEGRVVSTPDTQGALFVSLREMPLPGEQPQENPLELSGRIASDTLTLTASGLKLGELSPSSVPRALREQFRKLALTGEIGTTTLTYQFKGGGLEARTALTDVGLNLPIVPKPGVDIHDRVIPVPEQLKDRQLRVEHVKGQLVLTDKGLSGEMSGIIEDLPYDITFRVDGAGETAPFSARLQCKGFELKEHPQIVLFAPGVVRRRLEQFSNPTGIVNADVTVSRGQPVDGGAAEVKVKGTLSLRNGSAAFERFPYRFRNMSVDAEFDDRSLTLSRITGDTPEGATLTATTLVSPLTDDAGVKVDVKVSNLPVNATLAAAMKQRGQIIDVLFNQAQYRRLLEAGLVISPATHEQLERRQRELFTRNTRLAPAEKAELDDLTAKLRTPVFEPGGRAEVAVHVIRVEGPESIWNDTVDITFDRVGVLPEAFPYPMIGRNVVMRKVDYDTTVRGGTYEGLTGAKASIAADCDLLKLEAPDAPFVPKVEVQADIVPVDDLLLFALPDASSLSPDGRPLRELIRDLHLAGSGKAHAKIWQLEGDDAAHFGNTGYDIQIDAADLAASPRRAGQPARLSLSNLSGSIDIRHTSLALDLAGGAGPAKSPKPASPIAADRRGDVRLAAQLNYAPRAASGLHTSSKLSLDARAEGLDTTTPVEDLLWLFSPEASLAIADSRTEYAPEGRADLLASLRREQGGSLRVDVSMWKPDHLLVNLFGARMGLESPESSKDRPLIRFTPGDKGESSTLRFSGVPTTILADNAPAARVTLDGAIRTDKSPSPDEPKGLRIDLADADLAKAPVAGLVKTAVPPGVWAFLDEHHVVARFDASVVAVPRDGTFDDRGVVKPHSLSMVMAGTPVSFPETKGEITFGGDGGQFRDVVLHAPKWTASARGSWQHDAANSSTTASTTLSIDAPSLLPDLHACLPDEVRTVLKDLLAKVDGSITTNDLALDLSFPREGGIGGFKTSGRIAARGVALDAGLAVANANAVVDFSASRPDAATPVTFDLRAMAESLKAADVVMTDARVRAMSGEGPAQGSVTIPLFSADCHGGRVSGDATLSAPGADGRRRFIARAQGSDIRFASVIADFQAARKSTGTDMPPLEADATPDGSRGMIDFGVTMAGTSNTPDSRRGRGSASVSGGRIASMPMVVPLIRITNLELPLNEKLDYAQADFFLRGNQIEFEQAWISSPGIEFIGYGSMQWPAATVDVRVRGASRNRIPIVSSVMDDIRNELFTARVSGPVWDPAIGLESFSGTTQMIRKLVGATPSDAMARLQRIEQQASRSASRPRERESQRVAPAPPR